jgi:hypothetical protein
MNTRSRTLILASVILAVVAVTLYVHAGAQVLTPRPEELRFQAILSEPIAAPDRRSVVAGTSALLVRDRLTGRCFVAVTIGDSMGLSPAACDQ